MAKKCIICGNKAEFKIKNGSESYCGECAGMQFGDVGMLVRLEEEAKKLKKYIEDKQDEFKLNIDEDV